MITLKICPVCSKSFYGTARAVYCCSNCKNCAWKRKIRKKAKDDAINQQSINDDEQH